MFSSNPPSGSKKTASKPNKSQHEEIKSTSNQVDWIANDKNISSTYSEHRNQAVIPSSSTPGNIKISANPATQRIGYVRVSSFEQNPQRQLESVQLDRVFTDTASGKDTHRPQLEALLSFVREGDTLVVHSMDRLARNLDDLRRLVQQLTQRGVRVEFFKEGLTFTGEDSPMSHLMLCVMGAFAEFERSLIRERQREGICLAKQRGVYRGRKKSLNQEQLLELKRRVSLGEKKALIARDFGISRETLYQYLRSS
jgi:DNA invertase Pin-like site-specific DNA recombinase